MSTFLVTHATMHHVCSAFDLDRHGAYDSKVFFKLSETRLYPDASARGVREESESSFRVRALTALGREFFALNMKALSARYSDHFGAPGETDVAANDYTFSDVLPNKVQQYKAIQCLIYQSSEGDISEETSAAYKMLCDKRDELARDIVSELPAYKNAWWDVPNGSTPKVVRLF